MEENLHNIDHLVAVGSWNTSILTPEWVKENVLYDISDFTIEYPISGVGSLKYNTELFSFFIVPGRLVFRRNQLSDAAMMKIVEYARRIFQLLIHTPVEALGVNFIFIRSGKLEVFDRLTDMDLLSNSIMKPLIRTEIKRSFSLAKSESLNFIVSYEVDKTLFNFNFDWKLKKPTDITDIFGDENDLVVDKYIEAKRIISEAYKL